MATPFNLTAQINLRGPNNIKPIVGQIKKQLGSINADVNVKLAKGAPKSIASVTKNLKLMNAEFQKANANAKTLSATISTLGANFSSLARSSVQVASVNTKVASTLSGMTSAGLDSSDAMNKLGREVFNTGKRIAILSTLVTPLVNVFRNATSSAVEFNDQMRRLQQVVGGTGGIVTSISNEITRLSTTLGVASSDLAQVSVTLAQAGFTASETQRSLEALAKTNLAPTFKNIQQTTEGAIAALRQFELSAGDLESALGSINAVAAKFAVESSDIIAAIQRTGGVFASASKGVSQGTDALNEFIAVFTSVRATTRESAETIATGLRTIFTRIQRGSTINYLKEFGVELQNAQGQFVGAYEAIRRLSEGLKDLDPRDVRFSKIVEELGGFRQIGKVIPLLQQFTTAQQALNVAQSGQGSLTKDAIAAQKSYAVQITRVREEFNALIRDFSENTVFKNIAGAFLSITKNVITIGRALAPIGAAFATAFAITNFKAITNFFDGIVKSVTGLFNTKDKGGVLSQLGSLTGGGNITVTAKNEKVTAAIAVNTTALNANTKSLDSLTSAINSLKASGGTATLNKGGRVQAFASGGVVPGSGNRDTVPAMLTPGEFVIRKKAVETIGAGNLQKMNRYAIGGPVKGTIGQLKEANSSIQPDYRTTEQIKTWPANKNWTKVRPGGKTGKARTTAVENMQINDIAKGYVDYIPIDNPNFDEIIKYWGSLSQERQGRIKSYNKEMAVAYETYLSDKVAGIGARNEGSYDPLDFSTGDAKFYSKESDIFKYVTPKKVLAKRVAWEAKNMQWQPGRDNKFFDDVAIYYPKPFDSGTSSVKQLIEDFLSSNKGESRKTLNAARLAQKFGIGYNIGGPILQTDTVGAAIMEEAGNLPTTIISGSEIISNTLKDRKLKEDELANMEKRLQAIFGNRSYNLVRQGLDGALGTNVGGAINNRIIEMMNNLGADLDFPGIAAGAGDNFLSSLNDSVKGGIFESVLNTIKNSGIYQVALTASDRNEFFDFRDGLGEASKWFPSLKEIAFVDAKKSLDAARPGSIARKIGNEGLREAGSMSLEQLSKMAEEIQSTSGIQDALLNAITQDFGSGAYSRGMILPLIGEGKESENLSVAEKLKAIYGRLGLSPQKGNSVLRKLFGTATGKKWEGKAVSLANRLNLGGFVQKFAEGGEPDPNAPSAKQLGFIKSLVGKFYSDEAQIEQFMSTVYDKQTASKQIQQLQNAKKWTGLFKTLLAEGKSVGFLGGSPFAYYSRIDTASSSFDELKDEETIRAFLERGKLAFGSYTNNSSTFAQRRYNRSKGYRRAFGGFIPKFAEGGSAEDTVPALLTPGEFVINKKAAARIGSANLNKMNKADKISGFNKGGPVGMVQRFAAGGGVQDVLAQQSGMSTSKFMKELGKELDSVALDIIKSLQQTKKSFVVSIGKATNAFAAGLDPAEVEASLQEAVAGLAEAGGISDSGVIQKAASDLFAGIQAGLPLDQIQAKSAELTQITARQITTTDALDRAMQRLSLETGIAADELNKIKDTQRLEAKQFFEGDIGKQFDGVITRTFPKTFKGLLDNSFGKLTANITKAFPATAITGSLVSLKGSLDYFGSDIQKLGVDLGLLPEDVKNSLSTLGGVLGGAGQGAAIGQALGGLLGPAGALGGAIVGAVAGGIKGYFDAQSRIEQERIRKESVKSQKRFEDNLARAQNEPLAEDRQEALERAMRELEARNRELAEQMGKLGGGTVYGGDQIRLPRTEEAATGLSDRIKKFGENMQRLGEMRLQTESADSLNERQDRIDKVLADTTTKTQDLFKEFGQTAEAQAALATLGTNATEEQKAALLENLALSRYLAEQESLGVGARDALATWNANIADNLNATLRSTLVEKQAAIATQRAALAQENYNKQLESFTFKMDAVSQALNIFNNEMEFSLARLDNLNAGLAGEGPQGITLRNRTRDIIENPLAFSVEEFRQAAERVAGQGEAGQQISNLATASRIINQVLRPALANTEDRNVSGVREAVQAQIDELFPGQGPGAGVPADLQQAIDQVLDQSIKGITEQATQRQGEGQSFEDVTATVDQFSRKAAAAEETLKQLSEQREKEFQLFLDLEQRRADSILKQVNITQQLVKTQADFNQQLRDAIGEFSSLEEMNAGFNAQVQQLTGGETDPTAISDNIIDLERQQRAAFDRINELRDPANANAGQDNRREQEDLAREITNLQVEQKKYIQALELIANSNEKVSNAFKKLADEQKKAETGKDLLSILSSGSLEDILKLRTDIVGVQQALAGNTGFFAANPLASQLNPQVLDLLQLSQEERRRAEGVAIQGGIGGRFGGAAAGMAGQFFAMMETGINNATQQVQAASAEQLRALIELRRIAELQENNVIKQQENIDILLRGLNDELGGGDANEAQEKFIKALEDLGINLPKDITNRVLEGLSLVKMGIQGILLGDDLRNGYLGIVENAYANITEKLNAIADRMNEAAPRPNQAPNADSPPLGNPGNQAGGGRGGRGDDWLPDWLPDWWPVFDFRSRGGPIYAKDGMAVGPFKPRGKDTVPAMSTNGQPYMLQPGEFIVNKEAYQKNKGLVEAINGGMNVGGFGGTMYAARGGMVQMGGIQVPKWFLNVNAGMRQQAQAVAAYNQNYAMSGQYRREAIANLGEGTNVDYAQRNSMAMADSMQRTAEGANTIAQAATSEEAQSGAQTGGMFGKLFGRMLGGANPAAEIGGQIGGAMIGGIMGAFDNLTGGALSSVGQKVGSVFAGQTAEQPATPTPQPAQATPLPQPTPDVQAAPIDLGAVPSGPGGGAMSIPPEDPRTRPRAVDGSIPTPETRVGSTEQPEATNPYASLSEEELAAQREEADALNYWYSGGGRAGVNQDGMRSSAEQYATMMPGYQDATPEEREAMKQQQRERFDRFSDQYDERVRSDGRDPNDRDVTNANKFNEEREANQERRRLLRDEQNRRNDPFASDRPQETQPIPAPPPPQPAPAVSADRPRANQAPLAEEQPVPAPTAPGQKRGADARRRAADRATYEGQPKDRVNPDTPPSGRGQGVWDAYGRYMNDAEAGDEIFDRDSYEAYLSSRYGAQGTLGGASSNPRYEEDMATFDYYRQQRENEIAQQQAKARQAEIEASTAFVDEQNAAVEQSIRDRRLDQLESTINDEEAKFPGQQGISSTNAALRARQEKLDRAYTNPTQEGRLTRYESGNIKGYESVNVDNRYLTDDDKKDARDIAYRQAGAEPLNLKTSDGEEIGNVRIDGYDDQGNIILRQSSGTSENGSLLFEDPALTRTVSPSQLDNESLGAVQYSTTRAIQEYEKDQERIARETEQRAQADRAIQEANSQAAARKEERRIKQEETQNTEADRSAAFDETRGKLLEARGKEQTNIEENRKLNQDAGVITRLGSIGERRTANDFTLGQVDDARGNNTLPGYLTPDFDIGSGEGFVANEYTGEMAMSRQQTSIIDKQLADLDKADRVMGAINTGDTLVGVTSLDPFDTEGTGIRKEIDPTTNKTRYVSPTGEIFYSKNKALAGMGYVNSRTGRLTEEGKKFYTERSQGALDRARGIAGLGGANVATGEQIDTEPRAARGILGQSGETKFGREGVEFEVVTDASGYQSIKPVAGTGGGVRGRSAPVYDQDGNITGFKQTSLTPGQQAAARLNDTNTQGTNLALSAGQAGLAIATAGVSSVATTAGSSAVKAGLNAGAAGFIEGVGTEGLRNYDQYNAGNITAGQAVTNTLTSGVVSGTLGAGLSGGGAYVGTSTAKRQAAQATEDAAARAAYVRRAQAALPEDQLPVGTVQALDDAFGVVSGSKAAVRGAKAATQATKDILNAPIPGTPSLSDLNPIPGIRKGVGAIKDRVATRSAEKTAKAAERARDAADKAASDKMIKGMSGLSDSGPTPKAVDTTPVTTPKPRPKPDVVADRKPSGITSGTAIPKPKPTAQEFGRRIFGEKSGEQFIYRGSYGTSIEEGFDLTKMGSTGTMYGAGVYGGFDLSKAGQGKALAQSYGDNFLLRFIKENPGMTVSDIQKNFKGGLYKLKLKNPELFPDANAAFKGTREEAAINKILGDVGYDKPIPDSGTVLQSYNATVKSIKKRLRSEGNANLVNGVDIDAYAKAEASRRFADEGIPGMVAYENKTRYKGQDGSGVVSIFSQDAFEIAGKEGPNVRKFLERQRKFVPKFANGGVVYASDGIQVMDSLFSPKGPDKIPAMLAPNEFVVNRESAINNLDLLKQINASRGPLYMNQGGIVSGSSPAQAENYYGTLGGNNQTNQMGNNFAGYVEQLQNFQFPTIPERIEMVGSHTVDVNVNGAGAFESLQGGIMNMINSEIGKTMDGLWNQSNGAVGRPNR